ncbi:MAG: type II secretion system GspH family protein [Hydrogenobacter thermophilus]|uniref:PilW family protein n=1 Tax=Hydrogenobacter thermophilus TaxID=940 RepID=UPI001C75DF28|nr:type II secretion system protein [Hydrogenobacter thermophilus]QWK18967.1 MAG: type II secretion system GspH family protein [Hydrogenobacter thermophilus]
MKRAFTLVELLIVMAILLIIGAGLFYAFRTIFRQSTTQALVAKQEQDVQFITSTLVNELSTVGFGIDRSRLQVLNNGTNLSDVQGSNAVVAISGSEIDFLSLATRQEESAGCWGVTDAGGNLTTQARDYLFRPCTSASWGLPSDTSKVVCLDLSTKQDITSSCRNALAFFVGDKIYPADFVTRYYLDSSSTASKLCASGTLTLFKRVGSDTPQPLVDCVGAFRVRYIVQSGGSVNYADSVSDINSLIGIRLCMLLQVGERQSVQSNIENFSTDCGGSITMLADWRYYRWAKVEVDIPLRNIR